MAPSEPSVSGQMMNVAGLPGQQHDYMARVIYLALSGLGSFLYQAQDVSFDINLILHKEFI
jgi:hypothetical protein